MRLPVGSRLGPYEITGVLGAGGMGEVYRVRDTRLGREVAVKVVSERFLHDSSAVARFEREARAIAALSHPNIVALHDVGSHDGVAFAVMELLDGEPLDRRLATQPMSWRTAAETAAAIADGLAAAHARGVVHRDLKPANIFVTRDGLVKILDFGLAKQDPFRAAAATAAPTLALDTARGAPFGTVGYMSPEQVKGEPTDHRSDIFSLGCVFYEMLSGRRPFGGGTPPETLAAILRDEPPAIREMRSGPIAARLDALVRRCLEKRPEQRFQSARDLAFDLRAVLSDQESQSVSAPPRRPLRWQPLVIAAAAVVVGAILWLGRSRSPAPPASMVAPIQSIAVLPLLNTSSDSNQEYFADAMTDELTSRLAAVGSWRVTSLGSAMRYRGTQKRIPNIARELGVDGIVEGSVAREGSRIKIAADLVDGRNGRRVWADTYERNIDGVLGMASDIARAIAHEVDLQLTGEHSARLDTSSRRVLPPALEAYIRGRHALEKRSEPDLREAVRSFRESIDADPTYAPAYAGLADSYGQLGYGSYVAPEETFPRARAAARKALELDPDLAEAHASLGYALMYYDWNFPEAESEYKRAIALNPSYAVAHQWYAYWLTAMERPLGDAEREISTAQRLDPLSVPIYTDHTYVLHYYGRNEEALRSARLALEMNPKFALAYFWLGRIYTSEARYAEAEAAFRNIGPLRTWTPAMAALGFANAKAGRTDEARRILGEFEILTQQGRYASAYAIAVIYAGLGDTARTFSYLDAAIRERSHWLVWLKRDPRWNAIRSDARFHELVRKVGLPQER